MQNPTPKTQRPAPGDVSLSNVLNYINAADYINTVLGFDARDSANRYADSKNTLHVLGREHWDERDQKRRGPDDVPPYLDYWHYLLELLGDFSNGSYVSGTVSFVDIYEHTLEKFGPDNWRTYISKVWANEYPDEYTLWMSW